VPYTHVLLDLDHTLLDTETSLRLAFTSAMAVAGDQADEGYDIFTEINQALWRRVEAQELTPSEVHIARFRELAEIRGLSADPQVMADAFADGMGRHGTLYEGATELLESLTRTTTLAMVTNGLSAIQRARIARLALDKYFDAIIISGEVGCAKPSTEIFDLTFAALGNPDRSASLMVGDSLASDIQGGINAGVDTCWYNPHGARARDEVTPTHTISALGELVDVVRSPN